MRDAYDDLDDRLERINREIESRAGASVPVPSMETFRKHLRSLECFETVAARYGVKAANKRFKATGEGLTAHRPLLLATMDHTPADVHIVMEADEWRYVGRPFLTLIVDVHSRCILGWVLSFEPPSLYSVIECIRRANRPKPRMRDLFPDCPELADIYGKCDEIVVDNGLEFIGTSFENGMTDLGVSIRWAPIKSPTYKALVERFFLTLNLMLHNKLPGGTFPLQKLREWDLNPQKFAVLTLEQAEGLLDLAIGTYHQSLHRSLKDTPVRTWLRGVKADTGINILGDDSQLDKLLGAREERLVTRSGVELFNLRYHDPAITGPLLEDLARREAVRGRREGSASAKVAVKYNPANLGEIHVWNGPRGVYVSLVMGGPSTTPWFSFELEQYGDLRRDWFSPGETVAYLNCSAVEISHLVERGHLRPLPGQGRTRYGRSEVEEFARTWMNTREAAARLDVSPRHVWRELEPYCIRRSLGRGFHKRDELEPIVELEARARRHDAMRPRSSLSTLVA